ncbi:hypothetical protein Tco_0475956 [Tanacetum coccineum]
MVPQNKPNTALAAKYNPNGPMAGATRNGRTLGACNKNEHTFIETNAPFSGHGGCGRGGGVVVVTAVMMLVVSRVAGDGDGDGGSGVLGKTEKLSGISFHIKLL